MVRKMQQFDWIGKVMTGVMGTTISILLENVSLFFSMLAAIATALYMFQQFLSLRKKTQWQEEDRDNGIK